MNSIIIDNIQPAFIKTKIKIQGTGFVKNTQYQIYITDLHQNKTFATLTVTAGQDNILLYSSTSNISSAIDFLEGNFYSLQVKTADGSIVSNIAIGKLIKEPVLTCVSRASDCGVEFTETIDLLSDKIESYQIVLKHNDKILDETQQIYAGLKNNFIFTTPFAFDILEPSGSTSVTCSANMVYRTSNGYEGTWTDNKITLTNSLLTKTLNATFLINQQQQIICSYDDCTGVIVATYQPENGILVFNKNFKKIYKLDHFITNTISQRTRWTLLPCYKTDNSHYDALIDFLQPNTYYCIDENNKCFIIDSLKFSFEHTYLQDKTHIYPIIFNPKISSFKEVHQESKVETIGGQYPYIFRNGNIQYKEFQFSGLISVEAGGFYNNEAPDTAEQTEYSFDTKLLQERQYRDKLRDWLNNGEVKLFRSPTEGLILVRIMSVQLTPEVALGRLLYSFSCTAVEIDDINYYSLIKSNIC